MKDVIFVTGTDTGIGKTIVSLLLMQYFYAQGKTPFYIKPAQTGCRDPYDVDSDARFIYSHVPQLQGNDPAESVVFCFNNPKAPYFAARDQQAVVDVNRIFEAISNKPASFNPLIVEGAGGLMVPMTDSILVVDLIKMCNARPLIVARAGLGTINHTLLSLEILRNRSIQPAGVIFMNPGEPPVSEEMIRENVEAVEMFSGIKVSGVIDKINDFSSPVVKYYKILESVFA